MRTTLLQRYLPWRSWHQRWPNLRAAELETAATLGADWLLDLQNNDGGWPTFCRGWGKLPFDRSSNDISAHAIRGLDACRKAFGWQSKQPEIARRIDQASEKGLSYLAKHQQTDGSWLPLWFGNEAHPQEANPVYGTSKVLTMYCELERSNTSQARRGAVWLAKAQHASGGWGAVDSVDSAEAESTCSVEETGLAITALLPYVDENEQIAAAVELGLSWLIEAVEQGRHLQPAPIGFYFAKLWYHERLYPQLFATQALAHAVQLFPVKAEPLMASH